MRSILIAIAFLVMISGTVLSQNKDHEFGVTAGLWMSGDIELEDFGYTLKQATSPMIKAFYDYYIVEKFCVGMYGTMAFTDYPDVNESATMYEFGMTMKPRITVSPTFILKPGFNIGYRIATDLPAGASDVKGMGLNLSVEGQIKTQNNWTPHFEFGFLAQPVGGNDDTDVTFAPIWYIGGGVSF